MSRVPEIGYQNGHCKVSRNRIECGEFQTNYDFRPDVHIHRIVLFYAV